MAVALNEAKVAVKMKEEAEVPFPPKHFTQKTRILAHFFRSSAFKVGGSGFLCFFWGVFFGSKG